MLDFFLKERDGNANVAMCPHYNVVFDKNAMITYEKQKDAERAKEKQELKKNC